MTESDTFTYISPFPNLIFMFDGEERKGCYKSSFFADLKVSFSDHDELLLHRNLLSNASDLVFGFLRCSSGKRSLSKSRIEKERKGSEETESKKEVPVMEAVETEDGLMFIFNWPWEITKEEDKKAVVTVLRFCYGDNIVLNAKDCELNCAVYATIKRMQVKCEKELIPKLEEFLLQTAERDVQLGARLLKASVLYPADMIDMEKELAKRVLTTDRLHGFYDVTVTHCLNLLPAEYLDLKTFGQQYGALHSKCSEFAIRSGYLKANNWPVDKKDLEYAKRKEEALQILQKVNPEELNSSELDQLISLDLFNQVDLLDFYKKALIACERNHEEQEKVCGSTKFAKLLETTANLTNIPTGTTAADGCGAIYFPPKKCIVRTMNNSDNPGKGIVVTTLTNPASGENEVNADMIPFKCSHHAPIFDGNQYAYFMQDTTEGSGNRFGRLDLKATPFVFTELKVLPSDTFGQFFSGCWHHGKVFAVKNNAEIWFYDPSNDSWQNSGTNAPNHDDTQHVRLLSDPEDDADHIYAMGIESKKGLHRINLKDHSVDLVSAPEAKYSILRDALLIRIDATEFAVIASLDDGGVWYSYSSKNKQWKRIYNWRPSATAVNSQNNLVYASQERHLYYHVQGEDKWSSVPVDDKTFA